MFAREKSKALAIGAILACLAGMAGAAEAPAIEAPAASGSSQEATGSSKTENSKPKERIGIFLKKRYQKKSANWTAPPQI